jgi:DNA-binding LytR/AlgR family response regulator
MAPLPGLKVHRSWWVARGAVASVVQDGRDLRLRLSNGLEAPVARTNVAAVRAAGLLDDQGRGVVAMMEAQTEAGE